MHFSQLNDGTGGKAGRVALVAGLHVLVAMGVMHTMNSKTFKLPDLVEDQLVWIKPDIPPPPPPPNPPTPKAEVAPPEIVVPKPEVTPVEPPPEPTVSATTEAQPQPVEPMQSAPSEAPPAQPSTSSGQMRSAVLADANGCAKPDYPARAARNGESGTVTLALMVGADGRVKDARIQSSSGSRDLDRAALNALSLCQFKPAMNNGVAEAGWAQLAYAWVLE